MGTRDTNCDWLDKVDQAPIEIDLTQLARVSGEEGSKLYGSRRGTRVERGKETDRGGGKEGEKWKEEKVQESRAMMQINRLAAKLYDPERRGKIMKGPKERKTLSF